MFIKTAYEICFLPLALVMLFHWSFVMQISCFDYYPTQIDLPSLIGLSPVCLVSIAFSPESIVSYSVRIYLSHPLFMHIVIAWHQHGLADNYDHGTILQTIIIFLYQRDPSIVSLQVLIPVSS